MSWVAELDSRPIGTALARFGQPDETTHKWNDLYDHFCAKTKKINSLDINAELALCAEEKHLGTSNRHEGYGFLELLAVNPDSQGLGIGGMLFTRVENYLRSKGASALCLVTDDGCDWKFYQHKGLVRIASSTAKPPRRPSGAISIKKRYSKRLAKPKKQCPSNLIH
jgi:GNAT superfamily N-acetyltransferase